ncbi:MAG: hypothetical protein ACRD2N_01210 [Vicinamibacterales bacterium]
MPNDAGGVSIARQIGSVLLLFIGVLIVYTVNLSVVGSVFAGRPDAFFWGMSAFMATFGIVVVWCGIRLLNHWRLPLGLILLILSAYTVLSTIGFRSAATTAPSAGQANYYIYSAAAFGSIAAWLLILGLGLLYWEKRCRVPSLPANAMSRSAR